MEMLNNIKIKNIESNELIIKFETDIDIKFKKQINFVLCKPDWFIQYKDKIIIGYNQIDLWSGGHHKERSNLIYNKTPDNIKILYVIAKKVVINRKSKKYDNLKYGFDNNVICYTKNLFNIINDFFHDSI